MEDVLVHVVDKALSPDAVAIVLVDADVVVVVGCDRILVLSYAASTEMMEEMGSIIVWMCSARLALTL